MEIFFLFYDLFLYYLLLVKFLIGYIIRRMLKDDSRGVGEPLDETVCINNNSTCQGLTV